MSQNTGKIIKTTRLLTGGKSRRDVLKYLLGTGALLLSPSFAARSLAYSGMKAPGSSPGGAEFVFAQLSYEGGSWDAGPSPWENLRRSLESATSVSSRSERQVVGILDDNLFSYPFLFISGEDSFFPFRENELLRLRKYFNYGGTLFADDGAATPHVGFDASFRREIARIFPEDPLRRLPTIATIFNTLLCIISPSM